MVLTALMVTQPRWKDTQSTTVVGIKSLWQAFSPHWELDVFLFFVLPGANGGEKTSGSHLLQSRLKKKACNKYLKISLKAKSVIYAPSLQMHILGFATLKCGHYLSNLAPHVFFQGLKSFSSLT